MTTDESLGERGFAGSEISTEKHSVTRYEVKEYCIEICEGYTHSGYLIVFATFSTPEIMSTVVTVFVSRK